MNENTYYIKYDTIIAEVLSYLLSRNEENFIIKNFDIGNYAHRFYYEMLKMCYSLSGKNIYYKTNWLNFFIKKIVFFKNDKILFSRKEQGFEIDFNEFFKILEIKEATLEKIYKTYYYHKK